MRAPVGLAVVFALLCIGCASDDRTYYWSSYQWSAYSGNQINRGGPDSKRFEETLQRIIQRSDASGRKIAPGVLAEYGYLLLKRGETGPAVSYFEREAQEWPESEPFMRWVIGQVEEGSGS
ncbi:MAG: DUF4810 domain-containing protein [Myxococcota bacterium]